MRPTVPTDLKPLGIAALATLSNELRDAIVTALGADPALASAEDVQLASEMKDERVAIRHELASKRAAVALATEMSGEGDEDITEGDAAPDQTITPPPTATDPAVNPPAPVAPAEPAATDAPIVPVTTGAPSQAATVTGPQALLAGLEAAGGVPDKKAGTTFASWAELSNAMTQRADLIGNSSSSERFPVAISRANYPADRQIEDELKFGLPRFASGGEITAALCPPATPYYGIVGDNTMRRPVFGSMGQFQAPRGSVSVPVSPLLSDITGQGVGYGQWTFANDDDSSVKNCAVVSCNSWTTYQLYAVWKCLTIKNMMALTYPELVEAYLNRLGAAQARMAEILLLEAMATGTVTVNGMSLGYGTFTSFTSTVLEYLALYQETQRWDISAGMECWMPRWVGTAMQMDLMRRRTTNGDIQAIPSIARIEQLMASVGINVHWFIDTPSWSTTIPAVHTSNVMNHLPSIISAVIAPPGKFAVIDRGTVGIGVTGNNYYRDTASNRANTYTYFVETAEGLVNTNSLPAHLLRIPVCHNGVQVDDRLVSCAGDDELGYQS